MLRVFDLMMRKVRRRPMASNAARAALAAALLADLLAAGCATPVGVKRIRPEEANRQLTASVLTTGQPGPRAQEFLYRLNLTEQYREDPAKTIGELHAGLGQADESSRLFALAELSFDYAEHGGGRSYYLAAAAYAWAFLFPNDPSSRPGCYDPRVRTAMDLYNRGVAQGLATGTGDEVDLSARSVGLPFGSLQMDVDPSGYEFGGYQLVHFKSLADFQIRGLRNRYRRRGIGAPLAASVSKGAGRVDPWIGPYVKVPVTALLRFDDPRRGMSDGVLHGTIQLFYAGDDATTRIGDLTVPLEAERTAALAYQLDGAPLWDFEIAGFRRGDFTLAKSEDNLFMVQPYRPGRIPVVFVHGTASSPARWAEMTNELMNDPVLGRRYQFWFYLYNTGNPVAYSAMGLREALQHVVADVDPNGTDPALRQMVVIGHSQGGLLTKMTVVNSGSRFWENVRSPVPFEQADIPAETKDLLRRSIFVEPLPFVTEVVFICTPHRGSFLTEGILGNIARRLVNFPAKVTKVGVDIVKLNPAHAAQTAWHMPTAIDNMDWSNPFLKTLSSLPIAPGVEAHSIVAVKGDGPPEEGDDGVVKYTSAHIDGVASELIVRDGHSTQATPATIEEVRRILYAHLKEQ
jgi:pimeloyl-ACP methyl ester carboxylesterase